MIRNVSYSHSAFGDTTALVEGARRKLSNTPTFDTMIGTGLSGSLVVPILARAFECHWAIIRKSGDSTHANAMGFEGEIGNRWLFVDDMISSGATLRRVHAAVGDIYMRARRDEWIAESIPAPVYVGTYLYEAWNNRYVSAGYLVDAHIHSPEQEGS